MRALYRLSMISTLFSSLNTNTEARDGSLAPSNGERIQPVLFVMQKTMPIFKGIGEMYINHQPAIIEVGTTLYIYLIMGIYNLIIFSPDIVYCSQARAH